MSLTDAAAHAAAGAIEPTTKPMDQLCVNTIRTLAMDAVQAANSGHPGTPMALAPVVYCLWQRILRFDPSHPIWPNRDRFVFIHCRAEHHGDGSSSVFGMRVRRGVSQ
jgi:transketolase